MKTEYKYIRFEDKTEQYSKRTTQVWWIISKRGEGLIGEIKWFGRRRQYCFYPNEKTIFNSGCLSDIIDFLNQLKEERKKKVENHNAKRKER